MIGDFLQLPPIEDVHRTPRWQPGSPGYPYKKVATVYAFESKTWEAARFRNVRPTFSWRHRDCEQLSKVLRLVRTAVGEMPDEAVEILMDAMKNNNVRDDAATYLVCKKKRARCINEERLVVLSDGGKNPWKTYYAVDENHTTHKVRIVMRAIRAMGGGPPAREWGVQFRLA